LRRFAARLALLARPPPRAGSSIALLSARGRGEELDRRQALRAIAQRPEEAVKQFVVRNSKGAGQLDEGVAPGDPFASLKLPDGGPVQIGPHPQHFLGDIARPVAAVGEVGPEANGERACTASLPPNLLAQGCKRVVLEDDALVPLFVVAGLG
jgi:hypothetical protein